MNEEVLKKTLAEDEDIKKNVKGLTGMMRQLLKLAKKGDATDKSVA